MKILLFDIETSPNVVYTWSLYEANALKVIKPWEMICISWKWFGEKKTHVISQRTHKEKDIVLKLKELFDEADVIIGHNSDRFDIKKTNAKFVQFDINPPSTYKTVDTLKVARKHFKFDSNRLDALGDYFGVGRKIQTGGFDLWDKCINGDEKAYRKMERYNKQDVDLLESVYLKLRPFINNHPNHNLYSDTSRNCPNCGSENVHKRGYSYTRANKYQRWQCQDCRSWHQSTLNGVIR